MPARRLLETSTATWGELFSNGKRYAVPSFQRDYAWGQDEWSELWRDLLALRAPNASHYMGTVVLKQVDGGSREIIDGQQRLATLSIVALAIIAAIERIAQGGSEDEENATRARLLRDRLISSRHPASLAEESRLRLNKRDDGFFKSYLVQLKAPPSPSRLTGSSQRLWAAFEYFAKQIHDTFGATPDGAALAGFLTDQIAEGVQFIVIQVPDDLSAYTVFETLNARGLQLTATDLLKNYVFSLVASVPSDLDLVESKWEELIAVVGMEGFPDFAYHYLVSLGVDARKQRLFASIRERVRTGAEVFDWMEQLIDAAGWYTALDDPNDGLWLSTPNAREHLRALRLFGVDQYKPLVLALRARLRDGSLDVAQILRMCAMVSLRANIVGRVNTADILRAYQSAVRLVLDQPAAGPKEIFQALQGIYLPDEDFIQAVSTLSLSSRGSRKKLVKYLLAGVEHQMSHRHIDWETDPATIEHILPENPMGSWLTSFTAQDRERFTHRLGNLALLEPSINRALGAADIAAKTAAYATSTYASTQAIQPVQEWTAESIAARQRAQAKLICARFRLDF